MASNLDVPAPVAHTHTHAAADADAPSPPTPCLPVRCSRRACSQQVVDFVAPRLAGGAPPHEVASELLNACLANDPREARGIGCDNMTAAVRFGDRGVGWGEVGWGGVPEWGRGEEQRGIGCTCCTFCVCPSPAACRAGWWWCGAGCGVGVGVGGPPPETLPGGRLSLLPAPWVVGVGG